MSLYKAMALKIACHNGTLCAQIDFCPLRPQVKSMGFPGRANDWRAIIQIFISIDQTSALNIPDAQCQFFPLILNAYTPTVQHKTEHDLNLKPHLNASLS